MLGGRVGEAGQGRQGGGVDVEPVAVAGHLELALQAADFQEYEVLFGVHHPNPVRLQARAGVPVVDLVFLARHLVALALRL